jgi:ATP-binding cassette subfamily C protein CydC
MKYWFNLIINSQGNRLHIGILWAFLTALSGVALLMLSGWFITATAITGIAVGAGVIVVFDMYMPGSGIRFFALSRTVGRYVERIYNHDSILRLISVYRLTLFKALSTLPIAQLRATNDSEWLGRLTSDLDALDNILLSYIIPPIVAALLIVTLTFFMSFFWFELALYLGGFLLICLILSIRITIRRTKKYGTLTASLLNECRADIIEHLQGAFELQSNGLMQQHERKIKNRLDTLYNAQNKLNSNIANIQLLLDLVLGAVMSAIIFIGFLAVNSNVIDGPIAIMLVMMILGISEVLQSIPTQFGTWGKTHFSANRLTTLANASEQQHATKFNTINSIEISIKQNPRLPISHRKDLSLKLSNNQLYNIKGRSGSGKSTIAKLLIGTEKTNTNNHVIVNSNIPLSEIAADDWYKTTSYLEQSNSILAGTLGYNLALGIKDISEKEIWKVLKMVELFDWANALPDGLNSWLGEAGGKVSGGQARRICLARLLLRDPQLVVLDEPFNGIDNKMAVRIWHNMLPWTASRMVVLLTHERPDYLDTMDHVLDILLDDNDIEIK